MKEREQTSALLLRGGQIIDPSQGREVAGDLLIADGRIVAAGPASEVQQHTDRLRQSGQPLQTLDLQPGLIVSPGFVDLHVHLREPGYEDKETIQTGAQAAARGGFTTICCMPNTRPVLDSQAALEFVARAASGAPARVRPIAAISKGEKGAELSEMAELAEAGAVAFSDDGRPVSSSKLMRAALEYASMLDRPIVEHCEDEGLAAGGVMNEGAVATRLGLKGWPAAAEEIMLARDLALARLTGGRYHAAHVSTAGSVELIRRAKAEGLSVSAEVTPHHLLLTDEWVAGRRAGLLGDNSPDQGLPYDTATKVNPPLRTRRDAEALLEGLLDGTIDAIATDHAPHTVVDKACEYDEAAFGISGLETALGALLALVHAGKLPLATLLAALTIRPALTFSLPAGTLRPGAAADITIFDPQERWLVDPQRFASKGKNTPLAGLLLKGRVRCTILGGTLVYEAEAADQSLVVAR
ncbi:MAG TPA: dihydroorotase [Ktedonobacterales bacterium]|jgi:dihydroorotase